MLLQAYDFVELARRYGCNLQMGGSDQWGNIVTGIDLGRRMGTEQLYALTCPLLTTASGAKMGKTAAGAVWLNEEQLSAYDYWQFWRNTEDADVARFLKLFTMLPMDEVAQAGRAAGRRDQRGQEGAGDRGDRAPARPRQSRSCRRDSAQDLRARTLAADLPTLSIEAPSSKPASACSTAFVKAGLVKSNGEARRQIQGGGLKVNDEAVTDDKGQASAPAMLTADGVIKLAGQKETRAFALSVTSAVDIIRPPFAVRVHSRS